LEQFHNLFGCVFCGGIGNQADQIAFDTELLREFVHGAIGQMERADPDPITDTKDEIVSKFLASAIQKPIADAFQHIVQLCHRRFPPNKYTECYRFRFLVRDAGLAFSGSEDTFFVSFSHRLNVPLGSLPSRSIAANFRSCALLLNGISITTSYTEHFLNVGHCKDCNAIE
jgi:hypothetical protein